MTLPPTERQRAREAAWQGAESLRTSAFMAGRRGWPVAVREGEAFAADLDALVPRLLAALEEAEAEIERLTASREWWRRRVLIGGNGMDQDADAELAEDRADYFASTEDR